jgi:ESCRT-I complex subunit TSG101
MNQHPAYPPAFSPTPTPDPTGTITQEHLKASLRSAVEDKVRRSLREEYATKQVHSTLVLKESSVLYKSSTVNISILNTWAQYYQLRTFGNDLRDPILL